MQQDYPSKLASYNKIVYDFIFEGSTATHILISARGLQSLAIDARTVWQTS
jgi:hypothetical protein